MLVYAFIITILLSLIIGSVAGFIVGVILTGKYEESNKKKEVSYPGYGNLKEISDIRKDIFNLDESIGAHSIRIKALEEELHRTTDSLHGSMNQMRIDIMKLKDGYYELCEKLEDDNK